MSTFIVRVQLTHETTKNYALLSEILLKAGFTDKIKNENGIEYWLPTGNSSLRHLMVVLWLGYLK
jgi:hypothetical protein